MFKRAAVLTLLVTALTVSPGKHNYNWLSKKEFKCLVDNVYYEARGESFEGQKMVAKVVLNRTKHPDYPDSICGVVYQPFQFSWTLKRQKAPYGDAYAVAKEAAMLARQSTIEAIYYHAEHVRPDWAKVKPFITKEGRHLFYAG
ncbi:MAG: Spore cortex-lytic enzyme precursor [Parcubacteria group bacterium ADurb.Bin216]|nr:MAG: Spore cortex-lytic enzyme precursor [Parcubacteria group bacterium ADurb.Bin216]